MGDSYSQYSTTTVLPSVGLPRTQLGRAWQKEPSGASIESHPEVEASMMPKNKMRDPSVTIVSYGLVGKMQRIGL
jgi:hypothetical protein